MVFSPSKNGTLINADGADKNKNQPNLRPISFMVVRRSAWGLLEIIPDQVTRRGGDQVMKMSDYGR
jgi:hypothetical protein